MVGRFATGDTIRVVQPAEVLGKDPWELEGNKSCGLRLTFDLPHGKTVGTLTVRVCWRTAVFRDERIATLGQNKLFARLGHGLV